VRRCCNKGGDPGSLGDQQEVGLSRRRKRSRPERSKIQAIASANCDRAHQRQRINQVIVLDRMEHADTAGPRARPTPRSWRVAATPRGWTAVRQTNPNHDLGRRLSDLVREDVYDGGRIGSTVRSTIGGNLSPRNQVVAMPAISRAEGQQGEDPEAKDHLPEVGSTQGAPAKARFPIRFAPSTAPPGGQETQ